MATTETDLERCYYGMASHPVIGGVVVHTFRSRGRERIRSCKCGVYEFGIRPRVPAKAAHSRRYQRRRTVVR